MSTSEEAATLLETRPLSHVLGAEILGIDLRQNIPDRTIEAILNCWNRSLVILLRDQEISEDEQIAFARRFGAGELSPVHIPRAEVRQGLMLITNVRKDGKPIGSLPDGELQFHSDQCYIEKPTRGTMLYAMQIPAEGGNTLFSNMYMAYEALAEDMKGRLLGLKAMNIYDAYRNPQRRGEPGSDAPRYAHPVVRTHPVTQRKALYVSRLITSHIEGLPPAESQSILEMLFDHIERPEFLYEHVWRKGDVLIWDNRCTVHSRTDFDPNQVRMLRRATFKGEAVA